GKSRDGYQLIAVRGALPLPAQHAACRSICGLHFEAIDCSPNDDETTASISVGKVIKAEIAEPALACNYYKNTFSLTDRVVRAPFHGDTDLTFTIFND